MTKINRRPVIKVCKCKTPLPTSEFWMDDPFPNRNKSIIKMNQEVDNGNSVVKENKCVRKKRHNHIIRRVANGSISEKKPLKNRHNSHMALQ